MEDIVFFILQFSVKDTFCVSEIFSPNPNALKCLHLVHDIKLKACSGLERERERERYDETAIVVYPLFDHLRTVRPLSLLRNMNKHVNIVSNFSSLLCVQVFGRDFYSICFCQR